MQSTHREPLWPDTDAAAITVYSPDDAARNGTAVIICPGGGYEHLATSYEGHEIAEWLCGLGCVAVVLEYRMSREGCRHPIPLQDAQRAIRLIRSRAEALKIDPSRTGILGFSAGGHLAATVGTLFDKGAPGSPDPVERQNARPDFMVLCYPVICFGEPHTHLGSQRNLLGENASPELCAGLSCEKQVTADTPPTFLFHTDADKAVPPENSVAFYLALRKAGVPAELHVYQDGRHGVGLAREIPGTSEWSLACEAWLRTRGLLASV